MNPPVVVSDGSDPRLDDFRDLVDANVRADRRGVIIAEGVNVVERLIRSDYEIRAIVGVDSKLTALESALVDVEAPVYLVDKWTLSDAVGFRVTRGIMAAATRPPAVDPQELLSRGHRFVVLESVNDFENLGSLFRNAAAFGVDGVLLDQRCADPLYRRSVRVSMGHVLGIPFAIMPEPWPASIRLLQDAGARVLAMTPRAEAQSLSSVVPPSKWALLLGAEGPGLSEGALQAADQWLRIPMANGVDSLNVATAGAVAFASLLS